MKNILVPVDFSETSAHAAEAAANIAKQIGAKVCLFHVIDIAILQDNTPAQVLHDFEIGKIMLTNATKEMDEWKKKSCFEGLEVESDINFGNTFHTITDYAKSKNADLIVMGTKGASGIKEIFIGSNTEKIVRWSEVPVLAVKEKMENIRFDNILFISNFYGEVDSAFEKTADFFKRFDATFHLLKVITPANFEPTHRSHKIMEDFADKFSIEKYTVNAYNDATVEKGIKHFDSLLNPDVVVMPTHGRTGLSHLIYGSKTENVINHLNAPIMTFKIDEPEVEYGVIFPDMR